MRGRILMGVMLVLLGGVSRSDAQASASLTSAVGRARSMVDGGDGAAARALLDSLVMRAPPGSDDLAEALYWRGVLSERVAEGERDWKRLVVEAPLSTRVPEALLRLGELEALRGRPAMARAHFARILLDFPESTHGPKAMLWIARSYFDERDVTRGCETVSTMWRSSTLEGELRLQTAEMNKNCTTTTAGGTATTAGGTSTTAGSPATTVGSAATATVVAVTAPVVAVPAPVVAVPAPVVAVPAPVVAVPKPVVTAPSTVFFELQLAAYDTRVQANALVARLVKRGLKGRVDGERAPFRVRIGRYETRAEAVAMLARLKKQGQRGFVVEPGR